MPGHAQEQDPPDRTPRYDRGLSGDRTALAWTRSALSIAGAAVLTARAAFVAQLWILGVATGIALTAISVIVYRHAQLIYLERRMPDGRRHHQAEAFRLLTAATLATALVAGAVGIVIT